MLFDFDNFTKIVNMIYRESPYTKEDVLAVFREYFEAYENFLGGAAHPNINVSQIKRIIDAMPYFSGKYNGLMDIYPENYRDMIAQHFSTQYAHCDYNINHFFSGKIRKLRFYEACY